MLEDSKGTGGQEGLLPGGSRVIWLLVALAVGLFAYFSLTSDTVGTKQLTWSELKSKIAAGEVKKVIIASDIVRATPKDEAAEPWTAQRVTDDETFVALLDEQGIEYEARHESGCTGPLLVWVLPLLILAGFWLWFFKRMSGGGGPGAQVMTFGKSKHRLYAETGTGVNFTDVAGCDEAKEELEEVVSFLKQPERFHRRGGRIPKGVLLVGPPGTGKTLLAKAVAGEAGVPFFNISGSDFVEMFVGVGASRVRDLFKQAQAKAPCIVFIDELDAIGKSRSAGGAMGGNDEREQTLNALLVEMDGFDTNGGVILLAATNRPEILDPALLRPGRFDRQVLVDGPDIAGRRAILEIHGRKVKLSDDVDLDKLAAQTPGFVGADLANVMNEGALLAGRHNKDAVENIDLTEAIERVVAGLEKKNRRLNPLEKRIVAYHESGHAIAAKALGASERTLKISIIPRGIGALGYNLQVPLEDRYLMTRTELLARIGALLGGRAAEEVVFGEITTGAANDLSRVSDLARRMVTEYGMSDVLPNLSLGGGRSPTFLGVQTPRNDFSERTAELVDVQVQKIVEETYDTVVQVMQREREVLEEMSLFLLEHEVLESEHLESFLSRVHGPASATAVPADVPTSQETEEQTAPEAVQQAGENEL